MALAWGVATVARGAPGARCSAVSGESRLTGTPSAAEARPAGAMAEARPDAAAASVWRPTVGDVLRDAVALTRPVAAAGVGGRDPHAWSGGVVRVEPNVAAMVLIAAPPVGTGGVDMKSAR